MNEIRIEINHREADLNEIYFGVRGTNILFYKEIRLFSILMLALFALAIIGLVVAIYKHEYWYCCLIPMIFIIIFVNSWIKGLIELNNWKKSAKLYIAERMSHKLTSIILTEYSITFIEDEERSIVTWQDIKSVSYDKNFLTLNATKEFAIIRCSVAEKDFQKISDFIDRKVQNGL